MAQMNLLGIEQNKNDVVYTPSDVAMDIIRHFHPSGKCLEPSKGDGAFYKHMPEGTEYCEITEGKDFFSYHNKVDWIVGNPPYSIFYNWLVHSFDVADNIVYLLPVAKVFGSYRVFTTIKKYGGIKEIYLLGSGRSLGFEFGFAVAAVHFQRNYQGGIEITFAERRRTPLALDGGDSAAFKQLSTPEVLSTLQGESTPAHRK